MGLKIDQGEYNTLLLAARESSQDGAVRRQSGLNLPRIRRSIIPLLEEAVRGNPEPLDRMSALDPELLGDIARLYGISSYCAPQRDPLLAKLWPTEDGVLQRQAARFGESHPYTCRTGAIQIRQGGFALDPSGDSYTAEVINGKYRIVIYASSPDAGAIQIRVYDNSSTSLSKTELWLDGVSIVVNGANIELATRRELVHSGVRRFLVYTTQQSGGPWTVIVRAGRAGEQQEVWFAYHHQMVPNAAPTRPATAPPARPPTIPPARPPMTVKPAIEGPPAADGFVDRTAHPQTPPQGDERARTREGLRQKRDQFRQAFKKLEKGEGLEAFLDAGAEYETILFGSRVTREEIAQHLLEGPASQHFDTIASYLGTNVVVLERILNRTEVQEELVSLTGRRYKPLFSFTPGAEEENGAPPQKTTKRRGRPPRIWR